MGSITLTDLTGTTNPATVQANDVALVDNGRADLDNSTNVSQYKSRFVVTELWSKDNALEFAPEIAGGTVYAGAGNGDTPDVSPDRMEYNLCTFKTPYSVTLESMQISANNIGTALGPGLNGSNYWTFVAQTGTGRGVGATWSDRATLVLNNPSVSFLKTPAPINFNLLANLFFRVKAIHTSGSANLPNADFQITVTFIKENV